MPRAILFPPSLIDDAAEQGEEPWRPMDLVDNHELPLLRAQIRVRILEPPQIGRSLQVEVACGRAVLAGDLLGERRFPDLTRAKQDHGRRVPQARRQKVVESSMDHARKSNVYY